MDLKNIQISDLKEKLATVDKKTIIKCCQSEGGSLCVCKKV